MSFVYLPFSIGGGGGGGNASCDTEIVYVSGFMELTEGGGCSTYVSLGQHTVVLPESEDGDIFNFSVGETGLFRIEPSGLDEIRLSTLTSSAIGIEGSGVGSSIQLRKYNGTWTSHSVVGYWFLA